MAKENGSGNEVVGVAFIGRSHDPSWKNGYLLLAGRVIATGLYVKVGKYYQGEAKGQIHVWIDGKRPKGRYKMYHKTLTLGPWPVGKEGEEGIEVDVLVKRTGVEILDTRWI